MDQNTFAGLLGDFQQHCSAENNLPDVTAFAGHFDAPVIVLVHGIGGNAQHWADPVSLNPNDTWLFDLNATPTTGANGLGSSPPYKAGSVTSWTQTLQREGISYVTWSQTRPNDLLQYAADETAAVLRMLEARVFTPYDADVATNGGAAPPLILMCHSRGGLVTRAALKQLGSAGVPHLRKVITLCTPHHGSFMPRLADTYNRTLSTAVNFSTLGASLPGPIRHVIQSRLDPLLADLANRVRLALLHTFGVLAEGPGFDELDPNSAMMTGLAQDEQPLPGVQYYGFGGTRPAFINFYLLEMGRAFHLLDTASPFLVEQLARIPGVADQFGGLAELDKGDSAVGPTSSQWPDGYTAPHQLFPVNHMQALIDPAMQTAVLGVIRA